MAFWQWWFEQLGDFRCLLTDFRRRGRLIGRGAQSSIYDFSSVASCSCEIWSVISDAFREVWIATSVLGLKNIGFATINSPEDNKVFQKLPLAILEFNDVHLRGAMHLASYVFGRSYLTWSTPLLSTVWVLQIWVLSTQLCMSFNAFWMLILNIPTTPGLLWTLPLLWLYFHPGEAYNLGLSWY